MSREPDVFLNFAAEVHTLSLVYILSSTQNKQQYHLHRFLVPRNFTKEKVQA
jgi:hypothetical protein